MGIRRVAILGSTGSIGRQALDVIAADPSLAACALAARENWHLLAEQARRFRPGHVALLDPQGADALRAALPEDTQMLVGPQALVDLVRLARADIVLNGVVGAAGLAPTLAAIECGSALAIANKETLVMAGAIVMPAARAAGVPVLPVDSEHSAIFQCLATGRREEVRRVVLTSSGGALRDWDAEAADRASVRDALNHPTWSMGRKITIDSATLMNKALEIVEAHWLFDLTAEQIDVVIHPESIVHSAVEFRDGSMIAQLARPDMTTPIAYALSYPRRASRPADGLDLAAIGRLTFRPLPARCQRAVRLGYQAIRAGGTAGAALNGANEAAVEAFLAERIPLGRIVPLVEEVLRDYPPSADISLEALQAADADARRRVEQAVAAGRAAVGARQSGSP